MKLLGLLRKKKAKSVSLSGSLSFSSGSSKSPSHTPKSVLERSSTSLSAKGVEELREAFKVFDMDGDGKISGVELGCILRRLGHGEEGVSEEEVQLMVSAADKDGDGSVDLEEFMSLNTTSTTTAEDMKDAFHVFDADQNGLISAEELHAVLTSLGDDACTLHDCRRMIHAVDHDGDGFVDFQEFLTMMTN